MDLRGLGVCGLLDLVCTTARETNGEHTQQVAVGRPNVLMRLNERLPLANKRAQLVRREAHTVEVGQAVTTLHLIHTKLELAVGLLVVLVKVGKRLLKNTALERIRGILCSVSAGRLNPKRLTIRTQTLRAVHNCFTDVAVLEEHGRLDVVPFLAGEGINSALLIALTLGELLVLANRCDG